VAIWNLSRTIRARPPLAYLMALGAVACVLTVRYAFGETLEAFPFLTFIPAILVAAFFGGGGPGLLAAVLTTLLAQYFFIAPTNSLWPNDFAGWLGLTIHSLNAALMVGLITLLLRVHDRQRDTQAEIEALNAQLEARIAERTNALKAEMEEHSQSLAQLRQLQKMEAIGQLTGGIAHDFNNMLAIIIGSLDLAKRRLGGTENPQVVRCIDNASEGAQRAATLTARLLAFSRQQPLAPQVMDANKLVGGMSEMLRRTIGENIQVETVLSGGLWRTFADPGQLENAVINLAVNARDAMPGGGKLTIETANSELDDRYARLHNEVEPGQYVLISITDTGTGMSPDIIERAFDPFYTTKGPGKGTGLGLSQVFGYVKQSGGHVKIYSEVGQGTTLKIYLPRHLGSIVSATDEKAGQAAIPAGDASRIILVVEDEEQVRHMSVDALRELGYTVIQATGGRHALEQLELQPRVDLLFTDIVMPEMNGRQLADRAREKWPELKVLFTTGYTRNAVVHNGVLDQGVDFLPKPFTIAELALKISQVLLRD